MSDADRPIQRARRLPWRSRLLISLLLGALASPLASAAGAPGTAALRATIFGPAPQDRMSLPDAVPLIEMNVAMPWARPVPRLLWFDRRLRVWLSVQPKPAPLAIVIAGTGADGNSTSMSTLRGALYAAGYHVLTMPSPTSPGFIVSTSSTGVAGDLRQDSEDLYSAIQQIVAHLPKGTVITEIDVLGYSLGGAHAAMVKSIDANVGKLHIRRAVMINPPVSLYASMARLDSLFAGNVGSAEEGFEQLYRRLYANLANAYRAADTLPLDEGSLLGAAAQGLKSDADLSAAIAMSFRLELVDMFFLGDLNAGTGILVDPSHPPKPDDSLEGPLQTARAMSFSEYFSKVFSPYYLRHRADSTTARLIADNRLEVIAEQLRSNDGYYAQTNSDDLILDQTELRWLQDTLGARIAVYDHGGHLGTLGERRQIEDMLEMLAGRWSGAR